MTPTDEALAREMTPIEAAWSRFKGVAVRLRRRLPYVVWYGDQVDITVTFSAIKLHETDPAKLTFRETLYAAEDALSAMGVGFDRGTGDGRDWEWDWSLSGPISLKFRGRAQRPERRKEKPRPALIWSRQ